MAIVLTGSSNGNGSGGKQPEAVQPPPVLRRKRGRPRIPGMDPTTIADVPTSTTSTAVIIHTRPSSFSSRDTLTGVDRYMDDDYLREERRRRYRPEDFHVGIKDEHGNDERVVVRMHPAMHAAMMSMVRSQEFPHPSIQSILLCGAYEHMKKLYYLLTHDKHHIAPNWIAILDVLSRMEIQSEMVRGFQAHLDRLESDVQDLLRLGEFGEQRAAARAVEVRTEIKKMQQGWKEHYLEQWEKRWGAMVRRQHRRVRLRRGEE